VPQSRLFARYPYVRNALEALGAGEVAPVVRDDSLFHVLQLVRRIPAGTAPKLTWIEPKVRRRLRIRSRKQMYAREVQRLRTEAKARNDLVVRTP
jgi:parvulin-like peptidyl-prolyl isomerase